MARKAEAIEEAILEGDQVLEQVAQQTQMPTVLVKVVYKGGNPNKAFRLPGTVSRVEYGEGEDKHAIIHLSMNGYSFYSFRTHDAIGRPLVGENEIHDGRPFSYVQHPEHVLEMLKMRDDDGTPQFKVIGSRADIEAIRRYALLKVRRQNPDDGLAVLEAMGLAG